MLNLASVIPGTQSITLDKSNSRRNLSKHGLTYEEKAWLLYKYQSGICALCSANLELDKAVIDHDHTCPCHKSTYGCKQCIRGALCNICNSPILMKLEQLPRLQSDYVKSYLARRPFWKFDLPENNP